MKKTFVVYFSYDSGISISNENALVFAENSKEAEFIFKYNIKSIFSYNEDVCAITSIREISDDIVLIFTKNGACWTRRNHALICGKGEDL